MSEVTIQLKRSESRQKRQKIFVTAILICVVLLLCILMMTIGNTNYSLTEVMQILFSDETAGAAYTIKQLRLPRMIIGVLAGMCFGMAGYTFQTLLRNPLASPDVIGVSSGSSAAAVFCILILHLSGLMVSVISVIAGIVVTMLILLLSGRRVNYENRMILIGIGMQAFLNALINWMLLIGSEYDVSTAMRWLRGSLNQVTNADILPLFICFLVGFIGLLFVQKDIRMLQMGEEYAVSLGVKTTRTKALSFIFALLLCASSTAITGPIASVAFLSAPIATRMISKNQSGLVVSGLVGVILILMGELIGQNGFATRYPVGVVTGLLGAPYLLYLLFAMNRKEGKV